jgi:glycerophosphoryl diester phosphodiesterase
MATHPYLDADGPIAIAHRGGALESPENTMDAFETAASLGYRYLETDAQLTADGVVVAFHDSSIDRVSDEHGEISAWRWDELRDVPINGSGRLLTITDLLETFPTHRFNLDAKSDVVVGPLIEAIARADAFDRVCLGSFSDERIARMQRLAPPNVCTSYGPRAIIAQFLRSMRLPRGRQPGHAVQVPPEYKGLRLITKRFVSQAHRDGLAVHAWTIDDEVEMHRLLDLGVDGIMTDRPSLLKQVFESRGLEL